MMETRARNNLFYLLRAETDEARQARRRLAVGSAFAVFLGGLFTAVGLARIVLGLCLFVVFLVGCTAAVRALRDHRDQLRRAGRSIVTNVLTGLHRTGDLVHGSLRSLFHSVRRASLRSGDRIRNLAHAGVRAANAGVAQASNAVNSVGHSIAQSRPKSGGLEHEALRLNVAGTQHRRSGAHEQAIELHRQALEILHDGDDPRAVALTQNNLALAMSHAGDDSEATFLFEQAAATVRELGDRE